MNNLMSLIFEKMSLDDAKKKIRDMSTEEKNAFFSQEAQKPDFKGQTAGQKLYGLISSYVDLFGH